MPFICTVAGKESWDTKSVPVDISTVAVSSTPDTVVISTGEALLGVRTITVGVTSGYVHCSAVPPVTLQVSVAVSPAHSGPGSLRVRTLLAGETRTVWAKRAINHNSFTQLCTSRVAQILSGE